MTFAGALPGISAISETAERKIWWGLESHRRFTQAQIKSSAIDAGNTSLTTTLRAGLVMGIKDSDGLWYQCDPNGTDGTQIPRGILTQDISMLDPTGTAVNRMVEMLVGGPVFASMLLVEGTALASSDDRYLIRDYLARQGFIFDDEFPNRGCGVTMPFREVLKAADYSVLATDHGTLFVTGTGAVAFTLPTPLPGLCFEFLNLVDANMSIASAGSADDIVWDHDLGADSLAFSTASHKIGGRLRFRRNAANTKWYVENLSPATCTVTAA